MWFQPTNGTGSRHHQEHRLQMQVQADPGRGVPSTSSPSSTYSSPTSTSSPFSSSTSVLPAPPSAATGRRTMEDVWKEITHGAGPNTASCMGHHHARHPINHLQQHLYQPHPTTGAPPLAAQWDSNYQRVLPLPPGMMTLQEFLAARANAAGQDSSAGPGTPAAATPSSRGHQVSAMAVDAVAGDGVITGIHTVSPPVCPPITTGLSLTSSFDLNAFGCLDYSCQPANTSPTAAAAAIHHTEPAGAANGSAPAGNRRSPVAVSSPFPTPSPFMDTVGSPGATELIFPFGGGSKWSAKQRRHQLAGTDAGDNHQNRRIKNRESAARSRARKQAYTNELEAEVAYLTEEIAKLRAQNEEMRQAMAAQLPARKKTLHRSSTAPF